MTRLFLRWLNPVAIILMALLGIALQTSLFTFWVLPYFQPDIVLLLVLWCALQRSFLEGGILTILLADITEIHSSAPQGVFLITYMVVYLLVRLSDRLFVIPDVRAYATVSLLATVLSKAILILILHLLSVPPAQWKQVLVYVAPVAIINGLLGRWLFQKLDRFDWITFKSPRSEQMLEDEMAIESPEY